MFFALKIVGVITPKNAGEIGWTTSPESFGSELFIKNLKRNNLIVEVEANPKQDLLIQGCGFGPESKPNPGNQNLDP